MPGRFPRAGASNMSELRVRCAWCGKVMQEGELPDSHGICEGCAARYFGRTTPRRREDADGA